MFVDERASGEPWQPEEYRLPKRLDIGIRISCLVSLFCLFMAMENAFAENVENTLQWFYGAILSAAFGASALLIALTLQWTSQLRVPPD